MSNLKVFENMMENKLKMLHTAYLAKVLSTNGKTAKILPLWKVKGYGEEAQEQKPLSNVPILQSARWKLNKKNVEYVRDISVSYGEFGVSNVTAQKSNVDVLVPTGIAAGDIVLCVCCERDITEAKKGNNTVPALGRHSMSNSVIVGIL